MDIRKWLDEVSDIEALQVDHAKSRSRLKDRTVRKQAQSDSSFLEAQSHSHQTTPKQRQSSVQESAEDGACSAANHPPCTHSSTSKSSHNPYARKPRRKTRLNRYDPPTKQNREREKHIHQSRKDESKQSKRKKKRRKSEKTGSGIGQSFHAKNVSGDRLTLKPREQPGLFNKGRTSTAVKGRGLPDLVFSEMKFLQKIDNELPPDNQANLSKPKKRRKTEHVRTKEGEISSYFINARPAVAERDINVRERDPRSSSKIPEPRHCQRTQSSPVDVPMPTVEAIDRQSYLGFGSRGPRHESTSYVSWSDSVQAPSVAPKQPRECPTTEGGQHGRIGRHNHSKRVQNDQTDCEHFKAQAVNKQQAATTAGRFVVSSMEPQRGRISRSHSFPMHISSAQKPVFTKTHQHGETTTTRSSMPPIIHTAIDRERRPAEGPLDQTGMERRRIGPTIENRESTGSADTETLDQEPQSSSDLERVLRLCGNTFHERPEALIPRPEAIPTSPIDTGIARMYERTRSQPRIQRMPSVRFVETVMPAPRLPNMAHSRTALEPEAQHCDDYSPTYNDDSDTLYRRHPVDQGPDDYEEVYTNLHWGNIEDELPLDETFDEQDTFGSGDVEPQAPIRRPQCNNSVIASGFWRPNRLY